MRPVFGSPQPLSAVGHQTVRPRLVVHAVVLLAVLAGAACRDSDLTSPTRQLAPGNPELILTGGIGTNLFAISEPGTTQDEGIPFGLNDVGQVTGTWHPRTMPGSDARVFRWSAAAGAVTVRGCCGGDQIGFDINDAGVITGQTHNGFGGRRGFRATDNDMVILPAFSGASNFDADALGLAIN